MNAKPSFKINVRPGPPGRSATAAPLHSRAVAEIFKKTPSVADSKSGGRDVAKDMFDVGGMPHRMQVRQAALAVNGAVAQRGGVREKQCHADI